MKRPLLALLLLFLSAVTARAEDLNTSAQEGSVFFDGADRHAAAPAQPTPPQDKAKLLAELRKRVTIDDRGAPEEGKALNTMLDSLMDSPTARGLAEKFIREDIKTVISFEDIPHTVIYKLNGRKDFTTSGGHAHTSDNPPRVHLNAAFMEARTESAQKTLAHELFGHTLEEKRAVRLGVNEVNDYSQEEEANAGLVGWTVSAELGNRITDAWAWVYLADPQDYHKQLKSNSDYYSGTLSAEEMKNPKAAYTKRLADTEKFLTRIPESKKTYKTWLAIIDHFLTKHKAAPSSFLTLKEELSSSLDSLPARENSLLRIKAYLLRLLAKCDGEGGAAWTANLAAKSDDPYFKNKEREMEERRGLLAGLLQGQTHRSQLPPDRPGQVSWEELKKLWEKDVESGCGGKL